MISGMCSCLRNNTILKHLDFSFNALGPDDCRLLAQALEHNHTLLGIHVMGNSCKIDPMGFLEVTQQSHINMSPYSHRRMLANECNRPGENCWICEEWV